MTIPAGTRLGPYEILAPLGAGGMGEVYRARDGKLDRDVAVKVLPESVAADPDTLARFEREAKAVAAQLTDVANGYQVWSERFDREAIDVAVALAYAGKKAEAIREAERISAFHSIAQDARDGPYVRHQLARVYILSGEHEKALDVLESLLKVPYFLSPGWLKIDPNFDPLRNNPRFQKLVAR